MEEKKTNVNAAKVLDDLINTIGTVTYSTVSKEKIDAAQKAYDQLIDEQKALVTSLETLTKAEEAYFVAGIA